MVGAIKTQQFSRSVDEVNPCGVDCDSLTRRAPTPGFVASGAVELLEHRGHYVAIFVNACTSSSLIPLGSGVNGAIGRHFDFVNVVLHPLIIRAAKSVAQPRSLARQTRRLRRILRAHGRTTSTQQTECGEKEMKFLHVLRSTFYFEDVMFGQGD